MTHNRRIAPILPLLGRLVIRSITVQAPWSYGPLKPCTLWNTLNFTLKYSLWNCKRRRVFSEDSRRVALVAKPTWHRLAHCKRYQFQNSNKFFKTAEYSTRERERTKVCFGLPPLSPLLYSSSYGGSIAIDLVGCFFCQSTYWCCKRQPGTVSTSRIAWNAKHADFAAVCWHQPLANSQTGRWLVKPAG